MYAKSRIIAFLFAIVIILPASILADTIRLKDGSVIRGKVVGFKEQQFTVLIGNGTNRRSQLTLYFEDVESIEFDSGETLATSNNTVANVPQQTTPSNRDNANTATPVSTRNENRSDNSTPASQSVSPRSNTPADSTAPASSTATQRPQQNNSGSLSQVINAQPPAAVSNTPRNNSTGRFFSMNVKVTADATANGWTNSGLVVKKGQRLRISSTGRVSLGGGRFATPAGVGSIADGERLMKTEPTGALIAVIGDDNNEFIFIGNNREFVAQRDGTLFLGVNEGNLNDNSGAFDTLIEAEAVDVPTASRR